MIDVLSSKELAKERLDTCLSCEDLSKGFLIPLLKFKGKYIELPFGKGGQCKHCSCIMEFKVQLKDLGCPIQKW